MAEQKLFFDDVNEGDAAPAFSHELTRTDLVMYAGASGDFNPMHHDEVAAQAAGLPSVFGHGMFTAGLLAHRGHRLRRRRQPQVVPGPLHEADLAGRGAHHERHGRARSGAGNEVVLDCSVVNENGETKIQGEAVAVLPGTVTRWRRCASTSRRPTSRPSRSGTAEGRQVPHPPLQRVRRGPLLPAAVLPEVLERRRRVEARRSGRATLYTYSVVHVNDLPPFNERVPYVAAVVELEEGPR